MKYLGTRLTSLCHVVCAETLRVKDCNIVSDFRKENS